MQAPPKIWLVVGGIVVAAIWIGAGTMAWRGTWWPLIVVGCIAGSALLMSLGMAGFVRGRAGAPPPLASGVGRDAPPPRPGGQVGPRGRSPAKRKRKR